MGSPDDGGAHSFNQILLVPESAPSALKVRSRTACTRSSFVVAGFGGKGSNPAVDPVLVCVCFVSSKNIYEGPLYECGT